MRLQYPEHVRLVRVPCTGRVEIRHLLEALLHGADGVFVAGCLEGDCHYVTGNLRARQRVQYARGLLEQAGIEADRLRMYNLSAGQAPRFVQIVEEMVDTVRALGPNQGKLAGRGPRGAGAPAPAAGTPRPPGERSGEGRGS